MFTITEPCLIVSNSWAISFTRQAADLNSGLGASATQQAVVQSFLRNFDQVSREYK